VRGFISEPSKHPVSLRRKEDFLDGSHYKAETNSEGVLNKRTAIDNDED
jgi:hypothetical protein